MDLKTQKQVYMVFTKVDHWDGQFLLMERHFMDGPLTGIQA